MTKELLFDLEFAEDGKIKPISQFGFLFLNSISDKTTSAQIYHVAVDKGLHVRFANAAIRDKINR